VSVPITVDLESRDARARSCMPVAGRILVLGAVSRHRGGEAQKAPRGGVQNFDYLILKWRILMHISGILTYLF